MKKKAGTRKLEVEIWCASMLLLAALGGRAVAAQEIQLGNARPASGKGHVVLLSDSAEVEAEKVAVVELRFRVEPGFHINSHSPNDELLIPTALKLEAGSVHIVSEEYGPGVAFRLQVGAGETLDVYQGEFRVKVRLVAPKGTSTLLGSLRYQACDNAACFPAKTLPVAVAVTGKQPTHSPK